MPSTVIPVSDVCVREVYNEKRAKGLFSSDIKIDRLPSGVTIISGSDVGELTELSMNC
jgi:hypothetical protein